MRHRRVKMHRHKISIYDHIIRTSQLSRLNSKEEQTLQPNSTYDRTRTANTRSQRIASQCKRFAANINRYELSPIIITMNTMGKRASCISTNVDDSRWVIRCNVHCLERRNECHSRRRRATGNQFAKRIYYYDSIRRAWTLDVSLHFHCVNCECIAAEMFFTKTKYVSRSYQRNGPIAFARTHHHNTTASTERRLRIVCVVCSVYTNHCDRRFICGSINIINYIKNTFISLIHCMIDSEVVVCRAVEPPHPHLSLYRQLA